MKIELSVANEFNNHFYIMFSSIEELRQKVSDPRLKLIIILWNCLTYVKNHPESKIKVGLFWINDYEFMMNTNIFGTFLGRKPNSMNRNMRTHLFNNVKTKMEMRQKLNEDLPDSKHWMLRWCDGFTQSTTEKEAASSKYHENYIRKQKKKKAIKNNHDHIKIKETTQLDVFNCFNDERIEDVEPHVDFIDANDVLDLHQEEDNEFLFAGNDDYFRNEDNNFFNELNFLY